MERHKKILNDIASKFENEIIKGWEQLYKEKRKRLFKKFESFFTGESALEIGVGNGEFSQFIIEKFNKVTFVDGSKVALENLKTILKENKIENKEIEFVESLVENLNLDKKFDNIFLTHILEHLKYPIKVLKKLKQFLSKNGNIYISVPNANSIHRFIGVAMGLLDKVTSLNEQDIALGHYRVYTPSKFKSHIRKAGLKIIHFGGLMIKPLSNRQMEKWDKEILNAFFEISDILPNFCSEIFCVAKLNEE